ncbi:MAG TPA: diadenylate cyclase [Smithellaceae bacterium]|nr:MAG: DisA bacterial checkpoint controller nucleotide-binding protein [Deltaproteobacteria bacterium ADurb.BinA014]HNV64540.1 diadenylate cyclase [Smithellaceae bacterium]HNZ30462.1 diadenylate cyclase [Smithellaceae bacterium]HOD30320.1 diadenylate cyclase [Smithellaceae bacterium]HOZ61669.1 diadenylate cyclase [Smithellaceae bacterium]
MFKVSSIISGANTMKTITKTMIEHATKIARAVKANAFLICVDISTDIASLSEEIKKNKKVIIVSREKQELPEDIKKYAHKLDVPNVNLTRLGKIKIAVAKGIVLGFFKKGDKIVAISGVPKFGYADSIFVIDVGKEFEILTSDFINDVLEDIQPEVFNAVLNLACELAAQGREYRKVGTIFVLGDDEKVMQMSQQMIINPFLGYTEEQLNILNQELEETIKEFSAIDGAFIIKNNGVLVTAGRHLNAAPDIRDLPSGLGSRHIAAAGITNVTKAIAFVVSESSGNVSVFKNGKLFVTIEKPID